MKSFERKIIPIGKMGNTSQLQPLDFLNWEWEEKGLYNFY